MLTIKSRCSFKIVTRALHAEGLTLVGLLAPNAAAYEFDLDDDQLQTRLVENAN